MFPCYGKQDSRYINLNIGIYECESTGGSEWVLEDTISLKNIELQPEIPQMDMTVYEGGQRQKLSRLTQHFHDDRDHSERIQLKGYMSGDH